MRYDEIEEAGRLEIEFQGKKLDVYSLAVFQINLQEIIDEVSNAYLHGMITEYRNERRDKKRFLFSRHHESRIITFGASL